MEFLNRVSELLRRSGPGRFFLLFGVMLLIAGILLLAFNTEGYMETVGRVTSVTDLPYDPSDEDARQEYDVTVAYTVNGKEYEGTFANLPDNFAVGEEIKVLYDPADPERIANGRMPGFIAPVMIGAGVLMLLYGGYRLLRAFR